MKKFLIALLAFSLLTLASAHYAEYDYKEKITETKYFPSQKSIWSKTTYINYDNDNRFSTYDYRHGYSYRTTTEYLNTHYKVIKTYDLPRHHNDYNYNYHNDYNYHYAQKDYYYDYSPHLRAYEKKTCYKYPPKDKLFYTKCPNY